MKISTQEGDFTMLTEDQRIMMMYTGVSGFRNTEVNLRWSRSQMLIAINIAALPLLMTPFATTSVNFLISLIAIGICFFWLWVNQRTQRYVDHWQKVLTLMEPSDTHLLALRVFTGTGWKEADAWPNFYQILNVLPFIFVTVWSMVGFISIWPYITWLFNWLFNLFF